MLRLLLFLAAAVFFFSLYDAFFLSNPQIVELTDVANKVQQEFAVIVGIFFFLILYKNYKKHRDLYIALGKNAINKHRRT